MGMTMTQKILAAHAGLPEVKAGQLIRAKLDMVLGNDITSPVAIREFEKEGFTGVFDKSKISMVMDHFTPNKDIKAAEQCLQCRTFARQFDLDNFYDVGQMGVEQVTVENLDIVKVDEELNMIVVRGAIPGPKGGIVYLKNTVKNFKAKGAAANASINPQKASARTNPQKASARNR